MVSPLWHFLKHLFLFDILGIEIIVYVIMC